MRNPETVSHLEEDHADMVAQERHHAGCNAVEGDIVRNRTTHATGRVVCGLQHGRVLVELPVPAAIGEDGPRRARAPWERANVEIIDHNLTHWTRN